MYIHEHDHGSVVGLSQTSSLRSFWATPPRSPPKSPRELRALQGEVLGRTDASKRIAEYRSKHPFPVREPYPERTPALELFRLSSEFLKKSPRRQRFSPGSRPLEHPFLQPL